MVALVKHERYGFLICDNSKITSFEKMLPFTHGFNHSSRLFFDGRVAFLAMLVLYGSPSTDTYSQDFYFTRLDARLTYF